MHFDNWLRLLWADYFDQQNIQYAFFSAAKAVAIQQERQEMQNQSGNPSDEGEGIENVERLSEKQDSSDGESIDTGDDESSDDMYFSTEDAEDGSDPRARVLSVLELEALFIRTVPDLSGAYFNAR